MPAAADYRSNRATADKAKACVVPVRAYDLAPSGLIWAWLATDSGSMTAGGMAGSFVEDHLGGSQRAMPAGITVPAA
jgi:hypothetical protein